MFMNIYPKLMKLLIFIKYGMENMKYSCICMLNNNNKTGQIIASNVFMIIIENQKP